MTFNGDNELRDKVVEYVKGYYKRHGTVPSIKKICSHCNTYYKRLKDMFLQGLTDICEASGVPVPRQRIKQTRKAMRKRMMKVARERRKEGEGPCMVESPSVLKLQQLVDSIVEALLAALSTLHFSEVYSPNSHIGDFADEAARKLLERIGESDPEYLREILERDGYLDFLEGYGILNFDIREGSLDP